jgi:membrane carboxypeptidase/penicillin-binding protein
MPSAKVIFQSGNWVDNLTPEKQQQTYNEIVTYFTEEVKREVFEKYNKPVAYKN